VFFNVPVHYLYTPAVPNTSGATATAAAAAALATASADSDSMNVDPISVPAVPSAAYKLSASDAWPAHTKVITTYGQGEVLGYRETDGMYAVKLPFGVGYLAPSAIYGSEQLSANALYVSFQSTFPTTMSVPGMWFFPNRAHRD
jgi:hypothetical protein